MKFTKNLLLTFFAALMCVSVFGQEKEASPFDFGKMWTFENPPKEWFKEAYGFEADEKWFEDVRMSSLRFASWCSASFVSPNGLIMTNHHCSRDVVNKVQKADENFDNQGFVAASYAEERKVDELFVEQLVKTVDITDEVNAYAKGAENDADALAKKAAGIKEIEAKYLAMADWAGLRTQTVTYYSGGKYSLYGYKKYSDIRLVFIPELDLGLYGGDPDNFTYPRYNLDVTFWRAYDENGAPLNTSAHYLPFNIEGIIDQEPVFVVGNPGSTERYRTVAQLEYDRDYRFNNSLMFLTNRHALMMEEHAEMVKDPSKVKEAQALLGEAFSLSNSMKAFGGILKGLQNDELLGRKKAMEQNIRSQSPGITYWDDLDKAYAELEPHAWAINNLGPSPLRGGVLKLMHELHAYEAAITSDAEAPKEELEKAKMSIMDQSGLFNDPKEKTLFRVLMNELQQSVYPGNNSISKLLAGRTVDAYVDKMFSDTKYSDKKKVDKCLSKAKRVKKDDDMLIEAARLLIPQYQAAVGAYQSSSPARRALESKIANQAFQVYGTSLPPDATFTLRISDGIIDGYEYNGTVAPYKTTYYGLYDRHYSNDKNNPWSLPERWLNPPVELLQTPMNFVSTNDIIGGNSGSPMINRAGEAIGLIFDGNIESLPGNFIFDEEYNRTVSVAAGGIYAALKYIYKADNLTEELVPTMKK